MNDRNPLAVLFAIGAACAGLLIMASILLGAGNQIAALCKYLLVIVFLLGLTFPRGSIVFWFFLCGYTDLIKRLMVVSGKVSFNDLYYVLGIPPVMIGAITISVLLGNFTGRIRMQKNHWFLFFISCFMVLVSAVLAVKNQGGSLGGLAAAVANQGLYAMLIFLIPVLFQTSDDVISLLRRLLWIFLPVAVYGIFQQWNGFQDFEIEYLKSGITIEVKQLVYNEVRAFSTLNSPTALATVSTTFCALSLILWLLPRLKGEPRTLGWATMLMFFVIYFGSFIASTGRAAAVVLVFSMLGYFCFRSRGLTAMLYAAGGAAFVLLVLTADMLLNNMDLYQDKVSNMVGDSAFTEQLTRVGTYSERLKGYSNLVKNPDLYTLFGHGDKAEDDSSLYSHDILTAAIVKYGMVPTLLGLGLLAIFLKTAHAQVLRIGDPPRRAMAAGLLAMAMSYLVLSLLAGSVLVVFPLNAMAFLFCGLLMLVVQDSREQVLKSAEETDLTSSAAVEVAGASPEEASRVIYRFSQSGRRVSN